MLPTLASKLRSPWTNSSSSNGNRYYLPLAGRDSITSLSEKPSGYNHYSTDSFSSQSTSSWTPDSPSMSSTSSTSTPSTTTYFSITRKAITILLRTLVLILAAYGTLMFFQVHIKGRYMRTPVYTISQIAQAGWKRPELVADFGGLYAPPQPHQQHQQQQQTPQEGSLNRQVGVGQAIHKQASTSLQIYDFDTASSGLTTTTTTPADANTSANANGVANAKTINDLHVLILTPLKNAQSNLHAYLSLVSNLHHPKENTSIGFLIGDEEDETGTLVSEWCKEQEKKGDYRRISLLKKDFGLTFPSGDARHNNWLQGQRRTLMAKARSLLLTSTLEPTVDWVLWLDSDLSEASPSLIADLLTYGNAGVRPSGSEFDNQFPKESLGTSMASELDRAPLSDVITPNIMRRKAPGKLQGYDLNNWSETAKSVKMKNKLPSDRLLYEGNKNRPTYRSHLAHNWIQPNVSSSWDDSHTDFVSLNRITATELYRKLWVDADSSSSLLQPKSDLFDVESEAYIGKIQELDGIGGVATLVRAETHRFGAVFPSWLEDHEVETEGFGVLAKKAGARVVGLPNYLVMHENEQYPTPQ